MNRKLFLMGVLAPVLALVLSATLSARPDADPSPALVTDRPLSPPTSTPAPGIWIPTGSLNTARKWHTATLLNDGRVLVAGGWGSTYPYDLASAELYITLLNGRMNGGGSILTSGSRVAHDFDLLCNVTQAPNSLEVTWGVTWGQVNQFHLESLTMAVCTDDPAIVPDPPAAPFDTYQGAGTGRYNGVSGATIEFTFTDAGEPGENDFAEIVIRDAGGSIVLSLSGTLRSGNHQALKE